MTFDFSSEFLDPARTLECGQVFRYEAFREGYFVVSGDKACYLFKREDKVVFESDFPDYFYRYFDLGEDYRKIYEKALSFDAPFLSEAARAGKGIRILNQNAEEVIYSFILSQNNNIPRIRKIIENLCSALGERRSFMGKEYFSFPTTAILAEREKEFYRAMGAGYRDSFLTETARKINDEGISRLFSLKGKELKEALMSYRGIGEKVANCIVLFGFHDTASFPVDTWLEKAYKEDFKGKERSRKKIASYFEGLFKEYSGYMQQYLFFYKRKGADV